MEIETSKIEDQGSLIDGDKQPEIIESVSELTLDDVERLKKKRPKLLGIVCSRSDCKRDLHCFSDRQSAKIRTRLEPRTAEGRCRDCGVQLEDWDAIRVRDLRTVGAKFDCFQREWIRHFFFHVPITPRIEKYATKHGFKGLSKILEHQLSNKRMLRFIPALDFNQTSMLDGTIVHWARHATASCCRACMKYWHGVPLDSELTEADIRYFRDLGMRYIALRLPNLEPSIAAYMTAATGKSISHNSVR